jgi:hypothetical protein
MRNVVRAEGMRHKPVCIFRKVFVTFKYAICDSSDAWRRITCATSTLTSILSSRLWSLSSSKSGTRKWPLLRTRLILVLTNLGMIMLNDHSREVMYGIPWIMIKSFMKTDTGGRDVLEIKICEPLKTLGTYGRFRTTDHHICNCSSLM